MATIRAYLSYIFHPPFNLTKIICRLRGHPAGIVFYNPNGDEPDYHCRNCDDYLD